MRPAGRQPRRAPGDEADGPCSGAGRPGPVAVRQALAAVDRLHRVAGQCLPSRVAGARLYRADLGPVASVLRMPGTPLVGSGLVVPPGVPADAQVRRGRAPVSSRAQTLVRQRLCLHGAAPVRGPARAGGWPGWAGERRGGGGGEPPPLVTGLRRTRRRSGRNGRVKTLNCTGAQAYGGRCGRISILGGSSSRGGFSAGFPMSGRDRQRSPIGSFSYALFGRSSIPFLMYSLVSTEPPLVVSLLSDTSSGGLFAVIIELSVWYRRRKRRPCAER